MFASIILAASAVLSQAAEATEAAQPKLELTVMSFNIRYGTAQDGDNAWPNRRELLVDTIEQYDPDILGVQECLRFQADYLEEELKGYRFIGVGRERDGGGEMSAVFYKERHLSPISSGNFWLSESPNEPGSKSWDSSLPRMVTWATFFHAESGKSIHFANTHFDHMGRRAREESAKILAEFASTKQNGPLIITGDFNATAEESAPYIIMVDSGLLDAWTSAAEKTGPVVTFGEFGPPDMESKRRIDWILYRGALTCKSAETVTYNREGRYPSDHFPVVAVFESTE